MEATRENFKKLMEKLDIEGIKEAMLKTWNDEIGRLFIDVGFEVIEERVGEEEADRIYSEIWHAAEAA